MAYHSCIQLWTAITLFGRGCNNITFIWHLNFLLPNFNLMELYCISRCIQCSRVSDARGEINTLMAIKDESNGDVNIKAVKL